MARIYTQKTRKDRTCSKCGDKIPRGSQYRCASPGFRGSQIDRCMKPSCSFRQSDLCTSNMQSAWAGIEAAEDQINEVETRDDIKSALEDASNGIEESRDMYQEATDNWAGGMRTNEEWDDIIYQLEDAQQEIEGWEPDEDPDDLERDDYESDEEFEEAKEEATTAMKDSAIDMLAGLSLP
jgi:hypothetical protein